MLISVVIPVLNEEKYLGDCLRSLRAQNYAGDIEIIVVDNGSTDRSVEIAGEYGALVVISGTRRNVFVARNVGAFAARGDIIVQADADTIYPSNWLTSLARGFEKPGIVGVAGTFYYRERRWHAVPEQFLRHFWNLVAVRALGRPAIISGANFAFRRDAFLKVNGYDLRLYAPDQYGIASQLGRVGKVLYDDKVRVATSSRRVEKPKIVIARDFFRNVYRALSHILRDKLSGRSPVNKKPLIRATIIIPAIAAIAFIAYGYFVPGSTVFGRVYSKAKVPSNDKVIALSFDDGPNEPYTTQILDILDSHGIKATFFTTGKNVQLYPDTARRIVAEGHVLGNHSYSHNANHAWLVGGSRDIGKAENAIYQTVGVEPHFYRPPHGKKSPWELNYLKRNKITEVNWSIATNELHTSNPGLIADRIVKQAKPGAIIDLHDGYGNDHGTTRADKALTVEALPLIIQKLQAQGYTFVTISQLLGQPAYNAVGT